ncbi:MAG TPA: Holliday junction resolvase RuvX [Burkholderiaceae bacterium]
MNAARAAVAAAPALFLAFDFGSRRTGVASGNDITRSATPLTTLAQEGNAARLAAIGRLVTEWQPAALVVGVPRHPDGTPHDNTRRAERFARQLRGRFGLPVHEVDERYTTTEALASGATDVDAASAALILEQYFNQPSP